MILDWVIDHLWVFVTATGALVLLWVLASARYEYNNPYLLYGPEELLYFQNINGVYSPVYYKPCLKRGRRIK